MLSRWASVAMLVLYGAFLYFQLVTHADLFDEDDGHTEDDNVFGFWGCLFWLGFITVIISFLSEYLVAAIEGSLCARCTATALQTIWLVRQLCKLDSLLRVEDVFSCVCFCWVVLTVTAVSQNPGLTCDIAQYYVHFVDRHVQFYCKYRKTDKLLLHIPAWCSGL
jgi:hypothetical protein